MCVCTLCMPSSPSPVLHTQSEHERPWTRERSPKNTHGARTSLMNTSACQMEPEPGARRSDLQTSQLSSADLFPRKNPSQGRGKCENPLRNRPSQKTSKSDSSQLRIEGRVEKDTSGHTEGERERERKRERGRVKVNNVVNIPSQPIKPACTSTNELSKQAYSQTNQSRPGRQQKAHRPQRVCVSINTRLL